MFLTEAIQLWTLSLTDAAFPQALMFGCTLAPAGNNLSAGVCGRDWAFSALRVKQGGSWLDGHGS